MPKKDYIWTFNATTLAPGLDGNFSLEYHITGSKLKISPESLIDSRLWLVVRTGNENYLYGVLLPAMLEQYREGAYKGDYVMHTNAFGSVRFLPRRESKKPWLLPGSFDGVETVRETTNEEQGLFLQMLTRNYRVGFAATPNTIIDAVPKTKLNDVGRAVPDQLALTLRTVSFGDVSRSQSTSASLSALGSIALDVLRKAQPHLDISEATSLMASLDPICATADPALKTIEATTKAFSELPPMVDTFLEEIDPESISPRTFVASAESYSMDWLDKTNDAEEAHERILKDIVIYLRSNGFKVSKSRSFDLFAEKSDTRLLFEIKSTTNKNTSAQGEKGIVQLLRYASAVSNVDMNGVVFNLLLQASDQNGVLKHLTNMAERSGIRLWLYDDKQDWPTRIHGVHSEMPEWLE